MLIDGFTVAAQLINFLVLVWLLKRYLYRPVLDAIESRQKTIAAQLSGAEQQQATARAEQQDYQSKNELLAEQKETLLRAAADQAQDERLRILSETRQEAEALRKSFEKRQTDDYQAWQHGLALKTQAEVLEITRRILQDLAGASLEGQIVAVLSQRLAALAVADKSLIAQTAHNGNRPATVRSRFSLSPGSRESLISALNQAAGTAMTPQFDVADDLICGIEVDFDGRRVAWNVADYLDEFKRVLDEQKLMQSDSNKA